MCAEGTNRFSLKLLFSLMLLSSVFAAVTRLLMVFPDLIGPVSVTGFFVLILSSPAILRRVRRLEFRIALGCFVFPFTYLVLTIAYGFLIYYLRRGLE